MTLSSQWVCEKKINQLVRKIGLVYKLITVYLRTRNLLRLLIYNDEKKCDIRSESREVEDEILK